ncbi:hypothetical protein, partial [Aminobacter ciceronei]|uniref:hypothetical protein n=1 Tax=Aminobacter ciceronei TaxID=150723 RepID=UPI00360CAC83
GQSQNQASHEAKAGSQRPWHLLPEINPKAQSTHKTKPRRNSTGFVSSLRPPEGGLFQKSGLRNA